MKKILLLGLTFLIALSLVACGKSFTVTFETDGGSPLVEPQVVKNKGLVTEPGLITKEGFEFEYWFNVENQTKWDFKTDKVTSNLVLKASFKELEDDNDGNDNDGNGNNNNNGNTVLESKTVTLSYAGSTSSFNSDSTKNNASLVNLDNSLFNVLGTVLVRDYGNGEEPLPVGLNKDGSIRLYSDQSGLGNKLTVKLLNSKQTITKVILNFTTGNNHKVPTTAKFSLGTNEETLNGNQLISSVTKDNLEIKEFSLINDFLGEGSNQIWISSIVITYLTGEVVEDNTGGNTGGNTGETKPPVDPNNPSDNDETIVSYYNQLNGKEGEAFKTELTSMIKSKGKNEGSTAQVKKVDTFEGKNYNIYDGFGAYGNREHVWPNSLLGSVKYDLHNLRAAVVSTNSTRSNYPFGEGIGPWKLTNKKFYPGDEHKGDVARIVLYQHVRYNIPLSRVGNLNLFLKWHQEDPVSAFERSRNTLIQGEVGSRNPFIDYPEYVSTLFGSYQQQTIYTNIDDLVEMLDSNISLDLLEEMNYIDLKEQYLFL